MIDHIRQSNLIEGIDNPKEDQRSLRAWNWLIKQPELTQEVILKLHRKITLEQLGVNAGRYRKVQVYVGRHVPPAANVVPHLMSMWCWDMEIWQKQDPKELHIRFETIHPFIDGNGRTGRMLMWYHERQLGRDPTLLQARFRAQYYEWFKRHQDAER